MTEASHETSILRLQIFRFWRKSRTKCSFWCSHLSRLACLVFPWPRRVYGGSCKTCPFVMLPTVKIAGRLVQNAVLSRVAGFPVASPCLWGKLENISYSNVSKQVVMPFCVAGVALCDIPTCLMLFTKFQNWRKSRTKCSFFCTHVSRLESLVFLWRRRVYGGSSALHTLHFTLHNLHFRLHTPHSTLYTLHSTLYTLHFTLLTPHSRLYTLHFTLLTPHSRLYTPHSTLYTPHSSLYTLHSTLYTLHSTLYTPHLTLYTPDFTLYTPHSTLYTPHSSLYTPHSSLYTPHFSLYIPHSTLSTPHSTLHTLHSTFHTPQFTL